MRDAGEYRLLAVAVLASIMLHAALLFGLPWMERNRIQRAPLPGPVTARLVPPAPTRAPPAKVEVPPPVPKPVPRQSPPPIVAPVPAPAPAVPVLSAEPARPAAETAPPARAVAAVPAAPAVARAEPQPASQPASHPPSSAPDGPDPGTLARFRLEIMDLAKRHKRYPRLAIDNGWEGRVDVRMVVGANGALASLSVKTGAGYEALDQEALAMIRKAKSAATVPPALLGREFSLEVPVVFSLKEGGN